MPNIVAVGQISLTDLNDALVADSMPNAPHKGMLWIDSSITPPLLKKWDGADWIVIGEVSTEGTGTIIEDVVETIGNMANDNLIDYNERQVIKDRLTEILGYIITDTASSLPTVATLDGSEKGGFYSVRRSALNAGLKATDSAYSAVATHYNNLKSYLDGLTPIKPWDLRTENQDKNITVTKATFRDRWLQYYLAVDALATATAEKLKQNVDDIEVGGRNFASNGDFSTVLADARWSEYYHGNVKEIVDISTEKPPFRFALHVANTSNATGGIFTPVIFEGEEANALIDKDITVSYWLKYQNITQGTNTFDIGRFGEIVIEGENASGTTVNAYYRLGNSDTFGSSYVSGTDNEWKKYGGTLRIALPSGAVRIKRIRFKHGLESCKGEFWTTGLKIETGNKVTDWTENPLDLQGRLTDVEFKVLPDQIVSTVRSSEKYSEDLQNIEEKVAKLLTLTTSSHIMTFDANDNFSPSSQTITITANTQNIASTPIFTATPYSASGTQLSPITLGGSGNVRTLTSSQWLSNYSRVVIQASWSGYSDTITIVKVKDGAKGATGSTGSSGKDAIVGFLTNESITLSANVSGVVSDFSGATGTFEVYEGISRKTGSGVTYARTSQSGCTVTINSTGVYSVTAMSSDTATATFTATYGGVTITKTLSLSKSRVGATGAKGADGKGIASITEEYYLSTSSTTQTGGSWLTEPPAWVNGRYMWTRSTITYTDGSSSTTVPVNTTGARGATGSSGSDGIGITSVDVEYYLSTSSSSLSGGSWSTNAPTWVNGRYMWSRTKTVFTNGITDYSEPACITGAKGETGQKGADGKGVVSATVDYKNHTSGTTAPTGTWSSTVPAPVKGQYLWTKTTTTYTDNSTVTTYSVAYNATDGQKGSDGRGISSTTTTYQIGTSGTTAPTGSWVANPPTPIKGRYLWTRVVIEYTDGTSSTSYSTSYYATDGQKGDKGDTGVSVTSIVERYLATSASSGVSTGTSGWTDTIQTMTSTNKYLWNYEIINFSNGSTQTTTPVIIGVYGDKGATGATGATGRSITGITEYYLATSASSGVTRSTSGWTTDMQSTSTSKKYLWNYEMITWSSAPTTTYVEPVIIGVHGDTGAKGADGKGVVNATVTYKNHTSGTTAPTGTWSSTIPTPVKGQYLWTRTVTTYTDNSTVTTYSVAYTPTDGQNGANGKGISSTSIAYQISTSGTTTPTGTWSSTVPTPIKGRYLWTRTIMNYTDGTNSTSYSTSYYATDGQKGDKGEKGDDGISVTKVDVEFYLSTSSTTQTGGSWQTTAPTWVDGRYMWTRTKTTYSNGQTTTSPAVNVTGAKGSTGSTGRSVSALKEQYYLSTSKTTQTGGSWVDSPPTWVAGRYMWTRVHITYSNPSGTATTTPVVDASWEAIDGIEIGGRNLLVQSTITRGKYLNNTGGEVNSANWFYTDYIPVEGLTKLTTSGFTNLGSAPSTCYYDSNKSFVKGINNNGQSLAQSITIDSGISYIRFSGEIKDLPTLKIEKGNKATDWTPAPEDVEDYANRKTYLPVRYIRDHANGSSANAGNHWYEIQAYNTKGENVAIGKSVTSNGTLSNGSSLTDGITTTGTFTGTGNGKHYVQVNLGSIHYDITSIKVWRYYNDGRTYKETKTEVSPDGVTWYPIFDSAVEGTYPETSSGREFPNTYAKAESLLASKSVEVRVASAESRITQTENDITLTVKNTDFTGQTIVSKINQTASTVKIDAKNIQLNGAVTFSTFDSATQNRITSVESTASTASSTASSAKSILDQKASTWDAKETTSGAQNKANTAEANAKKYVDDNTGNLVKNPAVTGSHTGWSASGLSSVLKTFEGVSTRVLQSSVSSDTQNYSSWFKVDPSKAYEVSMWISKSASGQYYVGLNGIDSSGATVGFVQVSSSGTVSSANNTNFYFQSGTVGTTWIKIVGYIMPVGTNPADMKKIGTSSSAIFKQNIDRVRVRFLNWSNAGTTRQLWVANPKVVEVDPNAVIRGTLAKDLTDTWRYSNTTEINGAHIRTGTLSADKITTGVLRAIDIEGVNIDGSTITGGEFITNGGGEELRLSQGYIRMQTVDMSNVFTAYDNTISAVGVTVSNLDPITKQSETSVSIRGDQIIFTGRGASPVQMRMSINDAQGGGQIYPSGTNGKLILGMSDYGDVILKGNVKFDYTTGSYIKGYGESGITIGTTAGLGYFGSRNASYFHMDTDRPWFYMYKPLHINGKVIASDGLESRGALDMTNQNIVNVNRLEFADPGGNEGIEWIGGNGWKIVESPDDASNSSGNLQFFTSGNTRRMTLGVNGQLYLPSGYFYGVGESLLRLSRDTRSDAPHFMISMDTYNRTYSNAPNMYITGNGVIGRTTSASKYKLYIKNIENTLPDKILKLNPKSWFDKASVESYAQYLSKNNGIKNGVENEHLDIDIRRHYGLIAEDLVASGLEMYVQYGEPDENGKREVEGIEYDRLWTLLIPVVKELKQKTEDELNWLKIENQYLKRKIEILEEKV